MKVDKKKRGQETSLRYNISFKNYFPSGWIENFGVVPWFLSCAFLLAPCFFLFAALLFFVTRVFDTIFSLLNYLKSTFITCTRIGFLPFWVQIVKIKRIVLAALITFSLPVLALTGEITLAIGQHLEIPMDSIDQYTVGNNQIISSKLLKSKKSLVIKGKKIGYTELIVWKKRVKSKYQVYVLSKKNHLDFIQLAQMFKDINLSTKVYSTKLKVSGKLGNLEDYLNFMKIIQENHKRLINMVTLSKELTNELISKVYLPIFSNDPDSSMQCKVNSFLINCLFDKSDGSNDIIDYLKDAYFINFKKLDNFQHNTNYKVEFKIFQLENLNGEEVNLGLTNITSNLNTIFTGDVKKIIGGNIFSINQSKYNFSTLAEPKITSILNKKSSVSIGAELPFETSAKNSFSSNTQWKFAGLKIVFELKKVLGSIQLDYETEITRPNSEGPISGGKNYSSITLNLNQPFELFQVHLKTQGNRSTSFPILNKIPILGNLFKSKSESDNYKKIFALVKISKVSI